MIIAVVIQDNIGLIILYDFYGSYTVFPLICASSPLPFFGAYLISKLEGAAVIAGQQLKREVLISKWQELFI